MIRVPVVTTWPSPSSRRPRVAVVVTRFIDGNAERTTLTYAENIEDAENIAAYVRGILADAFHAGYRNGSNDSADVVSTDAADGTLSS